MKLDPGIHIAMHSVLSLKPGVTDCNTPNPLNSHLTCLAKKKNIVWDFVAGTLLE